MKQKIAFAMISFLFFLFGFITSLNNILIPYFKDVFHLTYQNSMLIPFAFFSGYFVFSIPSGILVRQIGYAKSLKLSPIIAGIGAVGFVFAAFVKIYALFLISLFITACGITLLQVAANPYLIALGSSETADSRLNLAMGFNSLGTTIAPVLGAYLILKLTFENPVFNTALPYAVIAGILIFCSVFFSRISLPQITDQDTPHPEHGDASPYDQHTQRMILGILGIFFYVGAEVGIGSLLANHIANSWSVNLAEAGSYVSIYWGLMMLGRFLGSYIFKYVPASYGLFYTSLISILFLVWGMFLNPQWSPYFFVSIGLFNSIMFPVIFNLTIEGMGKDTSKVSSYLCMSIAGGAVLPLLQGFVSDMFSVTIGFSVPLLSYIYLSYFAFHRIGFTKKEKETYET